MSINMEGVKHHGPHPDDVAIVQSMVGHTIVAAKFYDRDPDFEWTDHEVAEITLDDGRTIRFASVGYDASTVTVEVITDDA